MQQPRTGLNEIVGSNVKRRRQAAGWSQADLAERLAHELGKKKIDPTTITRMESGARPTTVAELEALEGVFGVPFRTFIATEADEKLDGLRDAVKEVRLARERVRDVVKHRAMAEERLRELLGQVKTRDYPADRQGDIGTLVGLAMRILGDDSAT